MKRIRKTKAKTEQYTSTRFIVTCPFCHTVIVGGFSKNVIRYKCNECENIMEIEY